MSQNNIVLAFYNLYDQKYSNLNVDYSLYQGYASTVDSIMEEIIGKAEHLIKIDISNGYVCSGDINVFSKYEK